MLLLYFYLFKKIKIFFNIKELIFEKKYKLILQ
jgi:hypothetical protein